MSPQIIHYSSHAFATYTYSRDNDLHQTWSSVSKDFNRLVQKIRRLHNSQVQYIRSIEAHKDSYPHIHAVWQFPNVLTITNERYFDRQLYAKWKSLWTSGLSDYQPPRHKSKQPILYIVKYISKSTPTYRTLWKKLLQNAPSVAENSTTTSKKLECVQDVPSEELPNHSTEQTNDTLKVDDTIKFSTTLLFCKEYNLKQLSWSRNFKFPTLSHSHTSSRPDGLSLDTYFIKHKR